MLLISIFKNRKIINENINHFERNYWIKRRSTQDSPNWGILRAFLFNYHKKGCSIWFFIKPASNF